MRSLLAIQEGYQQIINPMKGLGVIHHGSVSNTTGLYCGGHVSSRFETAKDCVKIIMQQQTGASTESQIRLRGNRYYWDIANSSSPPTVRFGKPVLLKNGHVSPKAYRRPASPNPLAPTPSASSDEVSSRPTAKPHTCALELSNCQLVEPRRRWSPAYWVGFPNHQNKSEQSCQFWLVRGSWHHSDPKPVKKAR
jgi:hypothetical protein